MIQKISLNGTWKLRYATGLRGGWAVWPDDQKFLPTYDVTVPGCVHEAMESITGDVTVKTNSLNARWIEESMWNYKRSFILTKEQLKFNIRLVFEGLDLTSRIYVNDRLVGSHNNFYIPCRLDITEYVHEGDNTVSVTIDSGLFYSNTKSICGLCGEYELGNSLTKRMWLRKPQCSFEWDWSPRLVNVGIYKDAYIELSNGVFANETALYATLNSDYTKGTLDIRQFVYSPCDNSKVKIQVHIPEADITLNKETEVNKGENIIKLDMCLNDPKLWYPVNYGSQFRYTVNISLECNGSVIYISKKTGFRDVVIDQSKHPIEGYYFRIFINGISVFAKGANMVPADILYCRLNRDVYTTLIDRACEANFNMLRVWGGGLYESDDFYDICDERGIMVWQDFIAACASYPGYENEFYQEFEREIKYEIRRLSVFPSLVIYSGNNELIWLTTGYNGKRYPDAQLYHYLIPKTLRAEGESRYYQPSSPYSFDNSDDNSDTVGDQHPWFIGFEDRDYFKYRTKDSRFPNEGGMLGPTSYPNMMRCFSEGQDHMHSFEFEHHDNSISHSHNTSPDLMLSEHLGLSTNNMNIRDYVYYGGFCQGEGLTEYILNFRRRMPSTSAAIFWMFNDCWSATRSWTIVDYLRNRTPAFYPVKRAFAPIAVDIVHEDDTYSVYCINEFNFDKALTLEYGSFNIDGIYSSVTENIISKANSSLKICNISISDDSFIPYAILSDDTGVLSRRRFIDKPYNKLGLTKCDISVVKEGNKATFTASSLVLGVCIDLDGDKIIGDNFFDLYPNMPYTVEIGENNSDVLYHI